MEDIYVVGVGMTPFGRHLDKDIKALTREATAAALADAGLEKEDLEATSKTLVQAARRRSF